jgi:hypothetical protein
MTHNNRPVRDDGLAPREVPYRAGGRQQGDLASRKQSLLDSGPGTGYVPGHGGSGRGSSAQAGFVHEEPPQSGKHPDDDELEYTSRPRPMPREIPVHTQTTHMGTIVRFLDGHSEVHRERLGLVEQMNDPDMHPDDREDIRTEIAHRDAINNHRYW